MDKHGTSEGETGKVTQTVTIPKEDGEYMLDLGENIRKPNNTNKSNKSRWNNR